MSGDDINSEEVIVEVPLDISGCIRVFPECIINRTEKSYVSHGMCAGDKTMPKRCIPVCIKQLIVYFLIPKGSIIMITKNFPT